MKKILIFPSGADNAIELYDSLRYSPHFDVYGATSQKDHSDLVYPSDRLLSLPFISEYNFIGELNKVIERYRIDLIFATHDTVLLKLVKQRAKINAVVIGCNLHTAELCRYKDKLYDFFSGEDFIPEWSKTIQITFNMPYFLKPVAGQGAHGCKRLEEKPASIPPGHIVCEWLPGPEYTVDCFTDRNGKLLFAGQRTRDIVKMGIAFKSHPVYSLKVRRIADALNERLKFRGLWFFQVKEDGQGNPKLLEVSSRISTTMGLFRMQGVNLPLLSVYDALDLDVRVIRQNFMIESERILRNLYRINLRYSRIYVDYDDTLVVRGRVNEELMKFLYQSLNDGKEIVLLTKHEGDIEAELADKRICADIFSEKIHLPPDGNKMDFLKHNSIYIDNMFHDREKAAALGIPAFDVDAVAGLSGPCRDAEDTDTEERHIRWDLLVPVNPMKDLADRFCDEAGRKQLAEAIERVKGILAAQGYNP